MIKVNYDLKEKINYLKFEDLRVGETFLMEQVENGKIERWIGMKIKDFRDNYAILDLTKDIGVYYRDVNKYKIIKVIELETKLFVVIV